MTTSNKTGNKSVSSHPESVKEFTVDGNTRQRLSDESDKVVTLNCVEQGPMRDTVEQIERLLESAKAGEVLSVAYCCELRQGEIRTSVPGTETLQNAFAMLGAIERLKQRFYELQVA